MEVNISARLLPHLDVLRGEERRLLHLIPPARQNSVNESRWDFAEASLPATPPASDECSGMSRA